MLISGGKPESYTQHLRDKRTSTTKDSAIANLIQNEPGEAHLDELLAKRVVTDKGYSDVLAKRVVTDEGYSEVLAKTVVTDEGYSEVLAKTVVTDEGYSEVLAKTVVTEKGYSEVLAKTVVTDEGYSEVLAKTVVTDEGYSEVLAKSTRCIQMKEHCMGPLKANSIIDKDMFCKILEKLKYLLIRDLKVNVALKEVATQSSLYGDGQAHNAVDGNRESNYHKRSCTHTEQETNPWWRVDLLDVTRVTAVTITNRGDSGAERLDGAEIRIGNSLKNNGISNPRCVVITHIPAGETYIFQCNEMEGRYVVVVIPELLTEGTSFPAMKKKEQSHGYRSIRKPQPVKSLRMKDWFSLTTSSPSAEVKPPNMKLRYDNTKLNFFEVFIKDADVDFSMKLISDVEGKIVWVHTIRKAEYRDERTQNSQSKHFVDLHRTDLIQRVSQVDPILDRLLKSGVITANGYSEMRSERTKQKKMRELFDWPLTGCGPKGKDIFLEILKEQEPFLIRELKDTDDRLLERGVIADEGYDKLRAKCTTQDQMRALYSGPPTSRGTKDTFYVILEELASSLIDELFMGKPPIINGAWTSEPQPALRAFLRFVARVDLFVSGPGGVVGELAATYVAGKGFGARVKPLVIFQM
eukprot:XP_014011960.1 PREDICTED: uncharacterized protein LOC106577981 [Salmo salar]